MRRWVLVAAVAGMLSVGTLQAQTSSTRSAGSQVAGEVPTVAMPLGTVRIPRAVKAEDQSLKAGTYQLRLSGEPLKPAVGQSPNLEQWVEFMQGGAVKGKAVASIVPAADIGQVAEGPRPAAGGSRVEVLKGDDYVRIWINKGGYNYLLHLPVG